MAIRAPSCYVLMVAMILGAHFKSDDAFSKNIDDMAKRW